jgi:hypothetical protein
LGALGMNSVQVNPGRDRLTMGRVGLRWGAGGWVGARPSWANGWDARVKKKTGRPAGLVRGGVGFRPKIEKRIGMLFHFQIFI